VSALFFAQIKHLQASYDALKRSYDELADRVLALEAEKEPEGVELDTDTLEPLGLQVRKPEGQMVRRKPGRPPKAKA
jgi:hypothetical protein